MKRLVYIDIIVVRAGERERVSMIRATPEESVIIIARRYMVVRYDVVPLRVVRAPAIRRVYVGQHVMVTCSHIRGTECMNIPPSSAVLIRHRYETIKSKQWPYGVSSVSLRRVFSFCCLPYRARTKLDITFF